jgi:hypothetical protein
VRRCLLSGDGGLAATMQLLHLFLEEPAWDTSAMERAKQLYISHYRALPKSLERASADRIMAAMLGPDRCAAGFAHTRCTQFVSSWHTAAMPPASSSSAPVITDTDISAKPSLTIKWHLEQALPGSQPRGD